MNKCTGTTNTDGVVSHDGDTCPIHEQTQWVIVEGSPVSGLSFYGTFDDEEDAAIWAEQNCRNDVWVISEISKPA